MSVCHAGTTEGAHRASENIQNGVWARAAGIRHETKIYSINWERQRMHGSLFLSFRAFLRNQNCIGKLWMYCERMSKKYMLFHRGCRASPTQNEGDNLNQLIFPSRQALMLVNIEIWCAEGIDTGHTSQRRIRENKKQNNVGIFQWLIYIYIFQLLCNLPKQIGHQMCLYFAEYKLWSIIRAHII